MVSPHHRRRWSRLLGAAAAVAGALVTVAAAPAAMAEPYPPGSPNACGGTQWSFLADDGCRTSAVIYPQPNTLLTRADLLRAADLYAAYGFSAEEIRTAPEVTIHVDPNQMWTGCTNNDDGICPRENLQAVRLGGSFPDGLTLTGIQTSTGFIAYMCGNFFPIRSDASKTAFEFVDLPDRIEADTPTPLTVKAIIVNRGPFPALDVVDTVTLSGPKDCTISPERRDVSVRLWTGQPHTFNTTFTVNCSEPSFHSFTATDRLVVGRGLVDSNPADNSATVTAAVPVFDDADLAVVNASLVCPEAGNKGETFECSGQAGVRNNGPYGPAQSNLALTLTGLEDCKIEPSEGSDLTKVPVAVGDTATATRTWKVTCSNRSHHPMTLKAEAQVVHIHVEDPTDGNNIATVETITGVFEKVDLETTVTDIRCSEREQNTTDSDCTATIAVTNNGPATAVKTETDVVFSGEQCTFNPTSPTATPLVLDAGETKTITAAVDIACSTTDRHSVQVNAVLRNAPSEPHAVDSDSYTAWWHPSDTKPRSLPSSVNPTKQGDIPFAILGTGALDVSTIDAATIRYGVTGSEDSLDGQCGIEDVNDDGRPDLVCHADTQKTGVACDTTVMVVTGAHADGTRFFSQDDVNIVGCKARI